MKVRQPRRNQEDSTRRRAEVIPRDVPERLPSPEKLRSEVLSNALIHPLTALPLIVAFLLGAYSLVIAPFIGGFAATFTLSLMAGAVGAVNAVCRFLTGRSKCEEKLVELEEENIRRQREAERVKTEQTLVSLRGGFTGFSMERNSFSSRIANRSLKEVGDLERANGLVCQEIARSKESKFSFDITARVEPLIEKTFSEGLLLLMNVLDLIKTLASADETRLREEIGDIERDLRKGEELNERTLAIKEKSLSSKKARIEQIAESKKAMELLLSRADECENTLRATCDGLTKMRLENSEDALDETLQRLQDCLRVAVEVRKQLKQEGINF